MGATLKQKRALKEIIENNESVSGAMRKAGYAPSSATKPSNLTRSKGWEELVEEYLPDYLIAEKHYALLTVGKRKKRIISGEVTEEIEELDTQALKAGLDMAYKVKGRYAPEKQQIEHSGTIQDGEVDDTSKKIILKHQIALKKELMESIANRAKEKEKTKKESKEKK